jgi:benzoyl-CoA reductase/2-hydroxyglutaryl-CoA dehydratase subunit BcrC/BadD/HgdB
VVTAEPLQQVRLHETLEKAGGLVVAEDDWWGSRAPGDDVGFAGSAMEAILRKVWLDTATANVYPPDAREAWLKREAQRPDIDAVVFYLPPSDLQLGWDYPRLVRELEAVGKPSLLLRDDASDETGRAAIASAVGSFLSTLSSAR